MASFYFSTIIPENLVPYQAFFGSAELPSGLRSRLERERLHPRDSYLLSPWNRLLLILVRFWGLQRIWPKFHTQETHFYLT